MKSFQELRETPNLSIQQENKDTLIGWIDMHGFKGTVIAGRNEAGFEHVSVSAFRSREIPTWDVMCKIKSMFWDAEEMVVQIHPAESQYVHCVSKPGMKPLENVMHLWRAVDGKWDILKIDDPMCSSQDEVKNEQ